MSITFYVIYTPNTVRLLHWFARTLVHYSKHHICLVANGCGGKEQQLLRGLAEESERLRFLALPTTSMWSHGIALNYLFNIEQTDYFAFMDSDVLATDTFINPLATSVANSAATFSCSPFWMQPMEMILPANSKVMYGRHRQTGSNVCLGSSYFAVYSRQRLNRLSTVDFRRRRWESIETSVQTILTELELHQMTYDTGKLITLLLHHLDEPVRFTLLPNLLHLGGVSAQVGGLSQTKHQRLVRLVEMLPNHEVKYSLLGMIAATRIRNQTLDGIANRHAVDFNLKRTYLSQYFYELLFGLANDTSMPSIPKVGKRITVERVQRATNTIRSQFEKFGRC